MVAGVIGLESVGLPFPGETVLILAGIFAGTKHDLNIVSVVVTAAVAAIVGQMIGYVIGREFGYWLLLRYGPYMRITESRIKLGEYLFLRHGGKIIFIARFVPVLRSLAGILAGANRMPWRQFLLANVVGRARSGPSFFGFAAYMLGHQVEHLAGPMVIVIGIAAVDRHRDLAPFRRPARGAVDGGSRTRAAGTAEVAVTLGARPAAAWRRLAAVYPVTPYARIVLDRMPV